MIADEWLEGWADTVNADPENTHIGALSEFTVRLLDDEDADVFVRYDHGTVSVDTSGGTAAQIELRGPRGAWRELVDPTAAPRRHDLLSLLKAENGLVVAAGRDHLLRHLRVLTRLVDLGRAHG